MYGFESMPDSERLAICRKADGSGMGYRLSLIHIFQVELAQLQYRMPRLTGFGKSLSRLGGGIGTRGPGEKQLETDRRHISRRMDDIRKELAQIKTTRSVQRSRREKNEIPVVALMGYTNSGKSALMNRMLSLSEKEEKIVMEKDMLFATLDTQQRSICCLLYTSLQPRWRINWTKWK